MHKSLCHRTRCHRDIVQLVLFALVSRLPGRIVATCSPGSTGTNTKPCVGSYYLSTGNDSDVEVFNADGDFSITSRNGAFQVISIAISESMSVMHTIVQHTNKGWMWAVHVCVGVIVCERMCVCLCMCVPRYLCACVCHGAIVFVYIPVCALVGVGVCVPVCICSISSSFRSMET